MKRFTTLGLCLVAAFLFAALAATGAAAKKSEHGVLDLEASGGAAHLGTESGSIKSSSNEGTAELTTATSGTAKTLFKGVEVEGFGLKCSSAGKGAGEVETELLTEETGWISKSGGEAGVDFKPHSGEFLAQFACEGLNVKVKGSVIGHTSPNNLENTHGELNLIPDKTPGKFRNSPSNFEGGPEDILRSSFSGLQTGNELESLQQQEGVKITNHGNPSVCKLKKGKEKCKPGQFETNTIAGPTPEYGRCIKKKPKGTGKYQEANCATLASEGKGQFEFEPVPN